MKIYLGAMALFAATACSSWGTLNTAEVLPPEAQPLGTAESAATRGRPTKWQKQTFGKLVKLVGHTYRGEPLEGSTEATADIQSWDWALGGAGLSIRHALEDRSYGGETLVYYDKATDGLAYVYVTNAGFRTEGVFEIAEDGSWMAEEDVKGHASIIKVRSKGQLRSDGSLLTASEYYQDDAWTAGNSFLYREVLNMSPVLDIPKPD
ncbi:MAG: hypothetical protein AAF950_02620 [Pseudomonadota bacterium]